VEAEGSGEAEVLATTPEGPAETQGAAEAEAVAREHPAERERMGAAAEPGAVLEAGLVERPFRVTALPAPRLEAEEAVVVVAPVAPEGTGKSESRGIDQRLDPTSARVLPASCPTRCGHVSALSVGPRHMNVCYTYLRANTQYYFQSPCGSHPAGQGLRRRAWHNHHHSRTGATTGSVNPRGAGTGCGRPVACSRRSRAVLHSRSRFDPARRIV